MNSQPNSHTHCQAAQANAQTQAWQRVCLSHPDKIELKKPSLPSENKKYATAQTDTTRTVKRTIDNGLQGRTTEHQPVTLCRIEKSPDTSSMLGLFAIRCSARPVCA
jgi:hypothetical protein